ncbi:MAG: hypothetical protein QW701_02450 [Candidatus Nezhaarchaeales archaeon]
MIVENAVCTGCSLFCNDIDVEVENLSVIKTRGACSHGTARLKGFHQNRLKEPLLEGKKVGVDEAVEAIAEKIKQSRAPLIYGGESSSNRVVELALRLAEKIYAYYDSPPSICRITVPIQEEVRVKNLTLDEILDEADFVLYWGVSIADTHLRHASKYAVMPRGRTIKMGRENRVVSVIDVRESMSMKIAQHRIVINPCTDIYMVKAIMDSMEGSAQILGASTARQVMLMSSDLKGASSIAIFLGRGIMRCGKGEENVRALLSLAKTLIEERKCSVHPLAENINSYGQAKVMWKTLGTCLPYNFKERKVVEPVDSLLARTNIDFVLAIGSDFLTQIPLQISKKLKGKIACTTELKSVTQAYSNIAVPVKILGVETGGVVTRTDGVDVELKHFICNEELPSEEEVLNRLLSLI